MTMHVQTSLHEPRSVRVGIEPLRTSSGTDLPSWVLTLTLDARGHNGLQTLLFVEDAALDALLAGFGWTRESFTEDGWLRVRAEVKQ